MGDFKIIKMPWRNKSFRAFYDTRPGETPLGSSDQAIQIIPELFNNTNGWNWITTLQQ
jgi:hypothetical protein